MAELRSQQVAVKSGGYRGYMGKWRRPRPIKRHALTKAAGYWGPWRFALALWLRLEAKSECALGPGATVSVLEPGYPDFPACGPWRGPINGLVQPTFSIDKTRPSRGGRRQDLWKERTPRLAPEERRFLSKRPSREDQVTQAVTTKAKRAPAGAEQ